MLNCQQLLAFNVYEQNKTFYTLKLTKDDLFAHEN